MTDLASIHTPVLLDDCVRLITDGRQAPLIVDCTLGLAGHASAFLQADPQARLIGIDRDQEALTLATERMRDLGLSDRFTPVHAAFDSFSQVLDEQGIKTVDAVFMDLGLSSLQIDENDRGFSYSHDAPLDMRMDPGQSLTARDVLLTYGRQDLARIFREYGQERFAGPIASRLVKAREEGETPRSTGQLVALVDQVIPRAHRAPGNPAKRVFQALRIEVNGELDKLRMTLPQAACRLNLGGCLVVESYHSLEDRITKTFMASGIHADVPAGLPVIPQEAQPFFADLTRGAVKAGQAEAAHNSRSTSVRLRAVELIRPIPEVRKAEMMRSAMKSVRTGEGPRRRGRPKG
ncbi:16S rRNA m(4)C1402 methyltransferase [Parascardovia denticolens IPLA 20019]|uniref:Ribosomal RNA small subunit methyltransferase H n=1 Tax=Parascardovia denticolens DSM 10105 = JCM 12538 TaxID=864564 RepID=E6JZG4_PARDN|nr:16S rRNA (cytosine(1402)-N(4))-methyltransferase RsmH [Parascardovia denticolens]EFG33561.1 S-adenosyl-methyltransferase MraW [Parascardovia denticolens F0305]EFT84010.1 S-adenosyl-methyltransferase MraW [Parascardovia denticolens DSM 10105 = JCM 12538]EIT88373.1 16S rRNA m(4)C1402 methyltransferase [Parascardovia denticolens IPLA 20019]BAR05149.1 S-adenosyl-methyltransferase [Parascardovia denticolens DSM 10105 = JCM 12538]